MAQQIASDVLAVKRFGKRIALIHNAADRHVPAAKVLVGRMFEVAVGMRIVQGSMFAERLQKVAALHTMQQRVTAVIRAVEQSSDTIKIKSPRVSTAFTK